MNKYQLQRIEKLIVKKSYDANDFVARKNVIALFSTTVQCGLFGIQDDHIESYLSLDECFIRNKHSTFIFKMDGDSMRPQIYPGDYLIVDRSITNFVNKIVVVDIFDERMCKLLVREQESVILRSLNESYRDIIVTQEMDMRIFGVAIMCFRDLVVSG